MKSINTIQCNCRTRLLIYSAFNDFERCYKKLKNSTSLATDMIKFLLFLCSSGRVTTQSVLMFETSENLKITQNKNHHCPPSHLDYNMKAIWRVMYQPFEFIVLLLSCSQGQLGFALCYSIQYNFTIQTYTDNRTTDHLPYFSAKERVYLL